MPKSKAKAKGKPKTPEPPEPPLSRLQRVIKKLGFGEVFPDLSKISDGDVQAALSRFLHYGERHTELGISSENFKFKSFPGIAFNNVKIAPLRSPLMEPYFLTLSLSEIDRLAKADHAVNLDEPTTDSDDFLGCRIFFRFVSEAVEDGSRVVLMQDEQQSVAVLVHVKALRKLNGDPGTALLQVRQSSFILVFCFCLRFLLPCLNSM